MDIIQACCAAFEPGSLVACLVFLVFELLVFLEERRLPLDDLAQAHLGLNDCERPLELLVDFWTSPPVELKQTEFLGLFPVAHLFKLVFDPGYGGFEHEGP